MTWILVNRSNVLCQLCFHHCQELKQYPRGYQAVRCCALYPKERLLKLVKLVPDFPIVVLTDRTDYDLIHFVMTMGAAEAFSLWQLAADNDRLKNIVESCLARARIAARQRQLMVLALSEAEKSHLISQEDSMRENKAALAKMGTQHTDIKHALRIENTVLRNDRDEVHAKLRRGKMPTLLITQALSTNAYIGRTAFFTLNQANLSFNQFTTK